MCSKISLHINRNIFFDEKCPYGLYEASLLLGSQNLSKEGVL